MATHDPEEPRPQSSDDFAETAAGAVVLVALSFLSLPVLAGGLALIGAAKLLSRWRAPRTGSLTR